jgi:hypothetical protein
MTEDGKKRMMQQCPQCSPEFGEEWSKRMLARLKVDDFLEVFVQTYEKSFTDDEILELIKLQEKSNDSQPPAPSPHLKEKLGAVMPTVMSEIMGGCTRIGAKLGAEIGAEIEKEHPEYTKAKPGKTVERFVIGPSPSLCATANPPSSAWQNPQRSPLRVNVRPPRLSDLLALRESSL